MFYGKACPVLITQLEKLIRILEPERRRIGGKGTLGCIQVMKVEHGANAKCGDLFTPKPAHGTHHKVPAWGLQIKSRRWRTGKRKKPLFQ